MISVVEIMINMGEMISSEDEMKISVVNLFDQHDCDEDQRGRGDQQCGRDNDQCGQGAQQGGCDNCHINVVQFSEWVCFRNQLVQIKRPFAIVKAAVAHFCAIFSRAAGARSWL